MVYLQALGHRSQFHLVNTGRDPSLQRALAPTRPSAGLLPGHHTGSAGSSGERGRLPALSSCNSSFSFRWSQNQTSGRSRLQTHCWSAHDWGINTQKKDYYYYAKLYTMLNPHLILINVHISTAASNNHLFWFHKWKAQNHDSCDHWNRL